MNHKFKTYPDGEGYIAEVEGYPHMYAFAYTKEDAIKELYSVLEMLREYYAEQMDVTSHIIKEAQYAV